MPISRDYAFGRGSLSHIITTSPQMQTLCNKAMDIANKRKLYCPDWGVTCGYRSEEEQFELYKLGRTYEEDTFTWVVTDPSKIATNCDGSQIRSVHQDRNAIDIYVVGEDEYDPAQLALVVTCFFEAADEMGIRIDWGGSFRSISDAPHIEIV